MHAVGQPPIGGRRNEIFGKFNYLSAIGVGYSRLHDVGGVYGANRYSESLVFFGVDENGMLYVRANFENVVEYRQDSELLYYSLAQAYEANNEIDKAISNYLKSIAVNDKFTLAYKKVGILFMARNDFEDAIEYFEEYANFDIPQEEKDSVNKLIDRIRSKCTKG